MKDIVILLFLCICPLFSWAITADGWDIHIENPTITSKLVKEEDVQTYTGEMTTIHLERTPRDGHVFVLIPIRAERITKNETPLPIGQIRIKQNKQIFNRVEDDSFLMDYDILPFTPFSINQKKCKGNLLFEIPLQKNEKDALTVLYKSEVVQTL